MLPLFFCLVSSTRFHKLIPSRAKQGQENNGFFNTASTTDLDLQSRAVQLMEVTRANNSSKSTMMQRLYDTAAAVRSILLCKTTTTVASKTSRMDPVVRSALAQTIENDAVECRDELHDLDDELCQARSALQSAIEKEQFLSVRCHKYCKALDVRARILKEEVEETLDKARMEQWERDQDNLDKINGILKEILTEMEEMRRKIRELERKKAKLTKMNEQCQEFMDLANPDTSCVDDDKDETPIDKETVHAVAEDTSEEDVEKAKAAEEEENVEGTTNPVTTIEGSSTAAEEE